jgi:NADH:ubiquinone oxidoreductase subunit
MGILSKIFTWWDGATIGTLLNSGLTGEHVGTDVQGNRYFRAKKRQAPGGPFAGQERRWVLYNGANDASRVPPEWHGWIHGTFDFRGRLYPQRDGHTRGISAARRAGAWRPPRPCHRGLRSLVTGRLTSEGAGPFLAAAGVRAGVAARGM